MRWFCIASGPSLTLDDALLTHGRGRTIAVNDAWRLAPWADILYACDKRWWSHHIVEVRSRFRGRLVTINEPAAGEYGLELWRSADAKGLSREPGLLHEGLNGGYQAINLAYLEGATEIILLGYDMAVGDDGRTHFFGDHPGNLQAESPFADFLVCYARIRPADYGIRIINCSRKTALTCFEQESLESALSLEPVRR